MFLTRYKGSLLIVGITISLFQATVADCEAAGNASATWPQWRGPHRDDISVDKGLLAKWPENGPPLEWTGGGLGTGYSSISIESGRIYTMGDRQDGEYLICLDSKNGKEIWAKNIGAGWKDGGPRCTPAVVGDLVYALTPHGVLVCASSADGSLRWQKDFAKDFGGKMMSGWGYSESPLVDGDRLICTPGADNAAIIALDRKTGEAIWKSKIEKCGGAGYSSIVKCNPGEIEQYVTVMGKTGGAVGVRASDGKLLWRNDSVAGKVANIPTPIVRGDYVFYSTGYDDGGSVLLKIVSTRDEQSAEEVYKKAANDLRNHHGGVVLVGDYLYGGHGQNQGLPFCIKFESGESTWKRQRGPGDRSAAVTYADGKLYFRYENGLMALVEANPKEFKLISTFMIPDGSTPSWSHPVIAGGRLYLRDKERLLCYDIRDPKAKVAKR